MMKWTRSMLIGGVWGAMGTGALMAGGALADVSVTLRATATIAGGAVNGKASSRAVTLADVAVIDPPTTEEATKIAEIVVIPAAIGTPASAITIAQVRAAMDAAKVHWGKTTLRGSSCAMTFSGMETPASRPTTYTTPGRAGLGQMTPQLVDVGEGGDGPATVRQAVSGRLLDLYNVDAADLRLAFDAADEDFLSQHIWKSGVERRVDVQPNGTGGSVRTPVSIAIYEGDRIAATRMIAVQALLNRQVVTARSPIARGQMIGPDLVEVGRQWMGPNAKPPVGPEAAVGQIAAKAIAAGAVLAAADVTAPIVCKRGDIVWVHALSGSLTVKAKCRAQGQARDGELVQLKMDGSDRTFSARMSGVGRAVMVTDGADGDGGSGGAAGGQPTSSKNETRVVGGGGGGGGGVRKGRAG